MESYPDMSEPDESGTTFAANAYIKARETALFTGHWSLADDSGICIDALGGAPGVYSARWAGVGSGAVEWIEKSLTLLQDIPDARRGAHYVCDLCLCRPDGSAAVQVAGEWHGRIAFESKGDNGFGYDPIFVPDGENRTAAQMASVEKDAVSHRGTAIREILPHLRRIFAPETP